MDGQGDGEIKAATSLWVHASGSMAKIAPQLLLPCCRILAFLSENPGLGGHRASWCGHEHR